MTARRGDVVLARVPHAAGTRGKKQPAGVIQSDAYNAPLRPVVVAEVTSNPRWLGGSACLAIGLSTPEGKATGLHKNGVISSLQLVTMSADRLGSPIASLSPVRPRQLDDSLKAARGLP
jgi:mRNA-degrading endonuclease toxin of MazEF toxin-antitoxin module